MVASLMLYYTWTTLELDETTSPDELSTPFLAIPFEPEKYWQLDASPQVSMAAWPASLPTIAVIIIIIICICICIYSFCK